jgi:hypothetical protein
MGLASTASFAVASGETPMSLAAEITGGSLVDNGL